jgi:hypothetical protein
VTAKTLLDRLAALRRNAEQRALELVVLQNERCQLAEHKADESADAVLRQVSEARLRERSLLSPLIGRPVSPSAITRVQTEIARAALETARLRGVAAGAQAALLDQRERRATAQQDFRARQQATMKLDLLLQQETARRSLRQVALSERDDEDRGAAMAKRR